MSALIQPSFARGEINPELFGRIDTAAYKIGLATARNMIVRTYGNIVNRPGLQFVGFCAAMGTKSRLRRFRFNTTDTYILEFSNLKMRVIRNDAYVLETAKAITGATAADPVVLTVVGHGFSVGDHIEVAGMAGMTRLNARRFEVLGAADADHISLKDIMTGASVNGTSFSAYTSGGTASRVYTLATPYVTADLDNMKFVQSADVMTITHASYPEKKLTRTGHTAWTLTEPTFSPAALPPTGVTLVVNNPGTTLAQYVVTSIDKDTGEESIASAVVSSNLSGPTSTATSDNTISWTARANVSQYSVYKAVNGIYGFVGSTPNTTFQEKNIAPALAITPPTSRNPFAPGGITSVNITNAGSGLTDGTVTCTIATAAGSGFVGTPTVSNGTLSGVTVNDPGKNYASTDTISFNSSIKATGSLTFSANPGAGDAFALGGTAWSFVAAAPAGQQSVIGASLASTLGSLAVDLNASADVNVSKATYFVSGNAIIITYKTAGTGGNAFTLVESATSTRSGATLTGGGSGSGGATATLNVGPSTGVYPAASSYYQQRQVRGGSNNAPDTCYYSQVGNFYNMSVSQPTLADDAITAALTSREVNEIRHFVPGRDLLIFTAGNEWRVNSSGAGFAADTITQTPQSSWGSSHLEPIVIGLQILFVPENRSIVRFMNYTFQNDAYTGGDVTLLSGHLFNTYTLDAWAFGRSPDPIVYGIRSDGMATALTYQDEQQVVAWTRWDTSGSFESVDVIRPSATSLDEVAYFVVRRTINGATVRYVERLHGRRFTDVRDCFFVDAGLSYDTPLAISGITVDGSGNIAIECLNHGLTTGDVVDLYDITWVADIDADGNETQPDQLNSSRHTILVTTSNAFTLTGVNGTGYNAYVSGGTARVPASTIAGLDHLEGRAVSVLADGNVIEGLTVSQGSITLAYPASRVHVGLPYISDIETLDLESPQGTIQGKWKREASVTVRFHQSRGLWIGQSFDDLIEMKQREFEAEGDPIDLLSGDKIVTVGSNWNPNGRVFLRQRYPLPMTVLAIIPDLEVED